MALKRLNFCSFVSRLPYQLICLKKRNKGDVLLKIARSLHISHTYLTHITTKLLNFSKLPKGP